MKILILVAALSLSGCISAGGLERCYGVKFPLVMVGPCLRTPEALSPLDQFRQSAGYMGK